MINRIRANHYNLGQSLERKGYINNARCKCGAEIQDIHHIVMSCIQYDEARDLLYQRLNKLDVRYSYNIEEWLKELQIELLKKMWKFIQKIRKIN